MAIKVSHNALFGNPTIEDIKEEDGASDIKGWDFIDQELMANPFRDFKYPVLGLVVAGGMYELNKMINVREDPEHIAHTET